MNHSTNNTDNDRFLDSYIDSARESANDDGVAEAAARLRQSLPDAPASRSFGWTPRFATAAVLVAGLALTLNLFVPGGSGVAFADVQAWFSKYQTLDVQTSIMLGEDEVVHVRARTNATGDTRIEQSGIVQILNAREGTFSTLLPGNRYFTQSIDLYVSGSDDQEWVEKLRTFKGEAVELPDSEVIRGRTVTGHRLQIDGVDLTLWSDVLSQQPVLLEGDLPGGLGLVTRFEFDTSFEAGLFEVPADFTLVNE